MEFRRLGRIVVPASLALLGVGAGAVVAYDASRDDLLADGTLAAGIDVGGLRTAEAEALLERRLGPGLRRPVRATYGGRRFTLRAARAHVVVDARAMVREALERGRDGNPVSRTIRDLTGGDVDIEVPLRVSLSRAAVSRFVRRVERAVGRPARNADIGYAGGRLHRVRALNGLKVRRSELTEAVEHALTTPGAVRRVTVRTRVIKRPDVTLAELARRYPRVITIETRRKRLRLYSRLRHVDTYKIAIGGLGFSTASGRYEIESKLVDPPWHAPNKEWAGEHAGKVVPPGHPENPLKARWMEFHAGQGIHGTDDVASLGSAASHGCIRMSIPEVKQLYRRVRVGTPVFID